MPTGDPCACGQGMLGSCRVCASRELVTELPTFSVSMRKPVDWQARAEDAEQRMDIARRLMNKINTGVYEEIAAERDRQDAKWGGPEHDDTHSAYHWSSYIEERLHSGDQMTAEESRRLFIEIGALAVAAVESADRKSADKATGEQS